MVDNPMKVLWKHAQVHGPTFVYYFGGVRKTIVTSEPAILRHVLKDNYDNYPKSEIQVENMVEFLGPGMLTEHGEPWKKRRRLIQHGFRPKTFGRLAEIMRTSLDATLPDLGRRAAAGPVSLADEMMALTFGMAARTLFGANMANQEIQTISDAITDVQRFMVKQIIRPYLRPWYAINGQLAKHQAMRRQGDSVLRGRIQERKASTEAHEDVLQDMIEAQATDPVMTDQQILHDGMQLLVAAHETSSTALTWMLYLLMQHPEYMTAVRDELESVIGDAAVEPRHVSELTVTMRVIKETLRLYPPFWMVDRRAMVDDHVAGVSIPADSTVVAFIYAAHHDPGQWPDPGRFDPDRFDIDDRRPNLGFTYLPFGGGPKSCIGERYALLQMTCVLHAVLRNYDVSLAQPTSEQPLFILRPSDGVLAHVRPRNTARSPAAPPAHEGV